LTTADGFTVEATELSSSEDWSTYDPATLNAVQQRCLSVLLTPRREGDEMLHEAAARMLKNGGLSKRAAKLGAIGQEAALERPTVPKPSHKASSKRATAPIGEDWTCAQCTLANPGGSNACAACGAARPAAELGSWTCSACTLSNSEKSKSCSACKQPRSQSVKLSAKAAGKRPVTAPQEFDADDEDAFAVGPRV